MTARRTFLPALTAALGVALTGLPAAADQAGFAFLEVPAGARASALGGAYASLARGADAIYWNPSALEPSRRMEIEASHYQYIQTLRHDQFALAGKAFGGGLAASVRAQYTEPIDELDDLGNVIGTFGSHDLEFALGYGRSVGADLKVGATAKAVRERIANASATTYAFDVGAGWQPAWAGGTRLAAAAQNLGPDAAFTIDGAKGAPVPLPSALQAGLSRGFGIGSTLVLDAALEGRMTRGRNAVGMLGAELSTRLSPASETDPGSAAALRFGWRVNDEASNMSLGAGYSIHSLTLDYAFVPYLLDLGDTHRLSLSLAF